MDIGVKRTGDLVYGIRLKNSLFIFKKDKAELLIDLYDWKLLKFCIASFDGLLVCMVMNGNLGVELSVYIRVMKKPKLFSMIIGGRVYTPQGCLISSSKKIRIETFVWLPAMLGQSQ